MPSPDPARMGKLDVVVIYQLPGQALQLLRLPAETFNDAALAAAIKTAQDERAAWVGKKLSV